MPKHDHLLRGARLGKTALPGPVIVQRADQNFVAAVLDELRTPEGRTKLTGTTAKQRDRSGRLRLFQPVHRTFHVALLEAVCDELGEPRIDPARVESAGLVIRRVTPAAGRGASGSDSAAYAWMKKENRVLGWKLLHGSREQDRDPDPARRRPAVRSGNAVITRALAERLPPDDAAEAVAPLFVAPPEVCKAAGKTVLFGVVQLSSTDLSEDDPAPFAYPDEDVAALLPSWLKQGTHTWGVNQEHSNEATNNQVEFLATIGFWSDSAEAVALRKVLDQTVMNYGTPRVVRGKPVYPASLPLGQELKKAADSIEDPGKPKRTQLSAVWTISAQHARQIVAAARKALEARMARVSPAPGRFDDPQALYRVRAFVRVRRCDGCPPELVWSAPSEPFSIVPWYESADLPPVRVSLPDANLDALKKLKPNVSFVTPASVADQMSGKSLDDLIKGKGGGGGMGVDWICGFSIPIITLCAFIVLNLFLQLLNILFWWLPLVKICIPLPKRR